MMHATDLPLKLWAEAINTACSFTNHTEPTQVKGKEPIELWFNQDTVGINHLRIVEIESYVYMRKKKDKNGL